MSEEILKALMQLFAILAKQDGTIGEGQRKFVEEFLAKQLNSEAVQEYLKLFEKHAGLDKEKEEGDEKEGKSKLTSVKDSVRILGICKKINKTLNQQQKIIVLVRLYQLINVDKKFTDQRLAIISTVSEVFKVSKEEEEEIKIFVIETKEEKLDVSPNIMVINDSNKELKSAKTIKSKGLDGNIVILKSQSVELYFVKYTGNQVIYLNGLGISNRSVNLFASGSTIKLIKSKPIYYSDVVSKFVEDKDSQKISFQCKNLEFMFPNGVKGVDNVSFEEEQGKLIGIMGVSGAGKTTLVNVLSGVTEPSNGEVIINGKNLHKEKEEIEGVIGLIPQDDLLIEELTVFENLFYNAKLCFKDKPNEEIEGIVNKTLKNLGLFEYKNLKVGSPMNKTISGGQRKRLNIALELVREPSILFVDEPTSGLSSRDSENVMDLLRELSLKGKIIFVVIHQPSSEIYKMFDKMTILDVGGKLIYYGNPIESVMHFKKMDAQINSDIGECPTCGTVNPEIIFNIIEARVVDEFGKYTNIRKVNPEEWVEKYENNLEPEKIETQNTPPPKTLNIPNWFNQIKIFTKRDFLSKISNKQYIMLNLLEAPILGFILSYIIRYIADPLSDIYIFRENENIPIFVFMSIIVALFLGLTISAEEIFKDRKILKRESFLNLSRSSYLISKIAILLLISAIQALTFVLIANSILGIKDMYFSYWLTLFSIAAFANLLGLNISASFNSVITIYILIPLLMIPMMVLSGAMFEFDKLNRSISSVSKVPVIAEMMPTKWAYEALMVKHFKDNRFEEKFYSVEQKISSADFRMVYLIPELEEEASKCFEKYSKTGTFKSCEKELQILKNELEEEKFYYDSISEDLLNELKPSNANDQTISKVFNKLEELKEYYSDIYSKNSIKKEKVTQFLLENNAYQPLKDKYHNQSVEDLVRKVYEKNKIVQDKNGFVQQNDPVFKYPVPDNPLDFRSHFFAPKKYFIGGYVDTFTFNVIFIWGFVIFFYIALYYEWLKKLLNLPEKIKINKNKETDN